MHIRTEISDRLVMTTEYEHIRNIYETCVYEITEYGLLWLSGRYRVGIDKATRLHNGTVAKIANEGVIHYCGCGEIARQYSGIAGQYLCAECWDISVGERC